MTPKKLSRRDAIKLLGAATGAAMLANLPSKWKTPELASGVLPAHAQTSSALRTLLCSPNYDTSAGLNPSSVTISPATSGISMAYNITTDGTVSNPSNPGTVLTNVSGIATLNNIFVNGGTFFTVEWSFTNPADGTGTCQQTVTFTIV